MQTYDYIVVGSGMAGLTVTSILAQHEKQVLLLEKARILGGSVARFRLRGIPFDVGFHFTGGLSEDRTGVLDEMLWLLGVRDRIHPLYFPREGCHRVVFSSQNASFSLPCGLDNLRERLIADFPSQRDGLEKYFKRFRAVVDATPTLAVSGFDEFPPALDDDRVTLQAVLDEYISDAMLQTILAGLCMCYGTSPKQVSFATHCRVCFGMQECLSRVEDGGDAFVRALVDSLPRDRVDIRTRLTIRQCRDVEKRQVMRFELTDGTEVAAKACIFTIHPQSILAVLPREKISKAFVSRIEDFEPSISFFSLFGAIDQPMEGDIAAMTSVLPEVDLNAMLTSASSEPRDGPLLVLRNMERNCAKPTQTVTALEVAFPESMNGWSGSKLRRRPAAYYQYKRDRNKSILDRIERYIPECHGVRVVDSASSLTFRDYLHSPDGSAYGIRQKIGQFNVSGRLPLSNLFAAGQCALLPGVIGAMTSAFFVCRTILGRDVFRQFLSSGKPCCSTVP